MLVVLHTRAESADKKRDVNMSHMRHEVKLVKAHFAGAKVFAWQNACSSHNFVALE